MSAMMRKIWTGKVWLGMAGALAALTALVFLFQPVAAQSQPPTDDEVNAVAKEMFCPVCENTPLDVCPTTACAQWRDLIREKLAAGWTNDQIQDYFALQYGDRVLSEPPLRGLNWLVYTLPVVFFGAGAVLVYFVLRSMRKRGARTVQTVDSIPAGDDPYLNRLEEELKKREKEG